MSAPRDPKKTVFARIPKDANEVVKKNNEKVTALLDVIASAPAKDS